MIDITRKQFDETIKNINMPESLNPDTIYDAFTFALKSADEMVKANMFGKVIPINPVIVLLYLVNEFSFFSTRKDYAENDETISKVVSIALDKYFTNEHLNFKNDLYANKFSVTISSMEIYLNLMLGILKKFPQKNPRETLLVDVITKALKISKAITELVMGGFETEAFSTWRTLHESECILGLIASEGEPIIHAYLKHMNYAIAFRGGASSKEECDKIFEQIKSEMKALDLKSKDMKKFIEYGWITASKAFKKTPDLKFNFRDGVEKLAGLSSYNELYEMASEIAHSSPLLIYSKNRYFYHLSILQLYESFFRIEKIFCSIYLPNVSKEDNQKFIMMRNVYYPILVEIYEREKEQFRLMNMKKASQ